jgi:hypothetical protein
MLSITSYRVPYILFSPLTSHVSHVLHRKNLIIIIDIYSLFFLLLSIPYFKPGLKSRKQKELLKASSSSKPRYEQRRIVFFYTKSSKSSKKDEGRQAAPEKKESMAYSTKETRGGRYYDRKGGPSYG